MLFFIFCLLSLISHASLLADKESPLNFSSRGCVVCVCVCESEIERMYQQQQPRISRLKTFPFIFQIYRHYLDILYTFDLTCVSLATHNTWCKTLLTISLSLPLFCALKTFGEILKLYSIFHLRQISCFQTSLSSLYAHTLQHTHTHRNQNDI